MFTIIAAYNWYVSGVLVKFLSLRAWSQTGQLGWLGPLLWFGIVATVLHCHLQRSGVCYALQHGKLIYSKSRGRTEHALFSSQLQFGPHKESYLSSVSKFSQFPLQWVFTSALEKQVHHVREQRKQDSLFVCNIVIKSILFVLPLHSCISFKNQFSYKLSNTVKAFASVDS